MHLTRKAFTLIELLVVIAIIAILAVVVVLTLNPAELLRQSRDSNRVSDMNTLNEVLGVYTTDQSGAPSFNPGSSSVVYVSIPDPAATTTAGTNCSSLGLLTLPSGWAYHCAASSTYKNVNGTGWIPVNLQNISSGAPISSLPIDPVNTSSSRDYYTYATNGTQYEITAPMESQKYGVGGPNDVISPDGSTLTTVLAKGSNLTLEPSDYGDATLVGWWPLTEGSGTTAFDQSGNGNNGAWGGTPIGINSTYYGVGKVGNYAGDFDGSTDYVVVPDASTLDMGTSDFTLAAWINLNSGNTGAYEGIICKGDWDSHHAHICLATYVGSPAFTMGDGNTTFQANFTGCTTVINNGTWHQFVVTVKHSTPTQAAVTPYIDGVANCTPRTQTMGGSGSVTDTSYPLYLGRATGGNIFPGLIDDARLYNRALSAAQISAMYNAGK